MSSLRATLILTVVMATFCCHFRLTLSAPDSNYGAYIHNAAEAAKEEQEKCRYSFCDEKVQEAENQVRNTMSAYSVSDIH